jgi:hypothetical protein
MRSQCALAIAFVAHAILPAPMIGGCAGVVLTFAVFTDWPPFNPIISPEKQAEQDRFGRVNLQLGYPYR